MDYDLPTRVKYWMNEAKHDCHFLVGPEDESAEKIGAIKALLMGDSEPFRVMLGDSELAETGDIRVEDVEPETFRRFLECVYGASSSVIPKLTFEDSAKLLYVCEKYLIDDLKCEIIDRMERLFSLEHFFDALSHPICYQEEKLKTKILQTLKYDFDKIIKDDKFLLLNRNAITWILQQEPIYVKEIEIWNAVLQWAKQNTGSSDKRVLRSCIYGFLKYIRFLTMDCDEFWEGVASTEILLEDEINDICKALVINQPCSIVHLCKRRNKRYRIHLVSKNVDGCIVEYPYQAFIHCSVSSVSYLTLDRWNTSETHFWADHFWCLSVVKKNIDDANQLSVFLECRGKTESWNCKANVEISLINQNGKPDKSHKFTTTFCPLVLSWGYPKFYGWYALLHAANGFLKEDSIMLRARIQLQSI